MYHVALPSDLRLFCGDIFRTQFNSHGTVIDTILNLLQKELTKCMANF